MGKKSKIILFSILGVVVVAAIAVTLYFVLRNPMSLSESRMVKDLQNDKGLTSQKISGFNFDFKVESIDYDKNKANSGDEELSLTAKADLTNDTYEVKGFPVDLKYTKEKDSKESYKLDSISYDLKNIEYTAVGGFPEDYAKEVVNKTYKNAKLDSHTTDLPKKTDKFTFKISNSDMSGKLYLNYTFDSKNGWHNGKFDTTGLDIKRGKTTTVKVDGVKCYTNPAVKNIILLGTDAPDNGTSRSDSMILVSIDSNNKEIKFSSFMRDTYVDIDGYNKDKLNAAFAYGGPQLAVKTIEKNYGIKIDNYISVGFGKFKDIVDALGGVSVQLDQDECGYINWQLNKNGQAGTYGEVQVKDGSQKLNGQQALWFCRDRGSAQFSGSDFTRTSRQRRMLMGLIESYKNSSVKEIKAITNKLKKYILTDLSKNDLNWLIKYSYKFFTYKTSDKCYPEETSGWTDGTTDAGAWIIQMTSWKDTRKDISHYIYTDLK